MRRSDPPSVIVRAAAPHDAELAAAASALARELSAGTTPVAGALELVVTRSGLQLRVDGRGRPVTAEIDQVDTRSPAGRSLVQPLAKAIGIGRLGGKLQRSLTVIDATAGLGGDTALLASWGCGVTAMERNPVVGALLRDGLRRVQAQALTPWASSVTLLLADAVEALRSRRADVVYLDPMFPDESRGQPRKAMVALRSLVGDDSDAPELFASALKAADHRVVVKRPQHAPPLWPGPNLSFRGKGVRYDVYIVALQTGASLP